MYLHRYGFIFRFFFPAFQWKVDTTEKQLFITFDDGPVPEVTEFALDELAKYNAKATFFCVGENVVKHPEVYKRILSEGHSVGNHTFNHLNARRVATDVYLENIRQCETVINQGEKKLFRPPYARLKLTQIRKLKEWGYRIVMWDVLTGDFARNLNQRAALKRTIKNIRPGSIVLMHDNPKHFKNMKYILPLFLEHFAKKGYTFKAL